MDSETEADDGANDTDVGGTTIGPGESSSGGDAPADCSCYDPEIDASENGKCLDRSQVLPGCTFEASPCEKFAITVDDVGELDGMPPTPEGAVTCLTEALAQGQLPPFSETESSYISYSDTNYEPLEDGTYVYDSCSWYDSDGGQFVGSVTVEAPEYFAACLEDHTGDESAMYVCLFDGMDYDGDGFPACGQPGSDASQRSVRNAPSCWCG